MLIKYVERLFGCRRMFHHLPGRFLKISGLLIFVYFCGVLPQWVSSQHLGNGMDKMRRDSDEMYWRSQTEPIHSTRIKQS